MLEWSVVLQDQNGKFIHAVSGMGQNKGTWDFAHSRRTAQRYAAQLRKETNQNYQVEHIHGD